MSVKIKGTFEINENAYQSEAEYGTQRIKKVDISIPKYQIKPHPGFEIAKSPNGKLIKIAYNKIYNSATPDLEIELLKILQIEKKIDGYKLQTSQKNLLPALKYHYKKAISILSPEIAAGWNRWSDNILDLFIMNKTYKILWGSGNCGKSQVMAVLLYVKWRTNPSQRMVVIASKIVADASARVYGYIKNIHIEAPPSSRFDFKIIDGQRGRGIYCLRWEAKEEKYVIDDQACIITLPVKVNAQTAEIGSNLLGKHPKDRLVIAFDEAQELPSTMLEDQIFANWLTNERLDVYAWGNPRSVEFTTPEKWDMLFKLGARNLTKNTLKQREKKVNKTDVWHWDNTIVLRFTMLDSPKDDPDEVNCFIKKPDGTEVKRLWFLGGKDTAQKISQEISPNTPSWYAQVLGFPYIKSEVTSATGVVTPIMIRESRLYPLHWKRGTKENYYMGIDPAASGKYDAASIAVIKVAMMDDGRIGVDVMSGKGCMQVQLKEDVDFIDSIVESMYILSNRFNIPLKNIAIETHGVGEALRYAVMRHIENGKWARNYDDGQRFHVINPVGSTSDRLMFHSLGKMKPANEIVKDINTELWFAIRCLFLTRQIFNVPEVIIQQLYQRHLIYSGGKYKLETKEQLKKRGIQSPNDADALSNAINLARWRELKYEFYDKAGYTPHYSKILKEQNAMVREEKGFSIVSEILGLETNLGQYINGNKVKKNKKIQAIDTI